MSFKNLKKYRNDIILISCLILLSFSSWFILDTVKSQGDYVVVMVNRKEFARYPLNSDREIKIKNGENYNILKIEDNSARIINASCPDKYCIKQGVISYNLQIPLTCKPNSLTVKIVSNKKSEVDFVS